MEPARELEDSIHNEILAICAEGDDYAERDLYEAAIERYNDALALLPEPKEHWDATLWILLAIGDAAFLAGWHDLALDAFHDAMANCPAAFGNPFIHLRLGELFFEAGDLDAAANELIRAYGLEGPEIFANEDPKYLRFLATRADLSSASN